MSVVRRRGARPRVVLVAVAALATVLATLMASSQDADAIIGGYQPSTDEWPWLVAVTHSKLAAPGQTRFQRQICGGTVLTARLVLTAAHCVVSERTGRVTPAWRATVVVGTADLTSGGREIGVSRVIVHPRFTYRHLSGDVALLVLASDAELPPGALLPAGSPVFRRGLPLTVAGWGTTRDSRQPRAGDFPVRRLAVDERLRSTATCRAHDYGHIFDPVTQLCAGGPVAGGHGDCYGDSGGPLMAQVGGRCLVVGAVSYGYGCARAGEPGFFARVAGRELQGWILDWERRLGGERQLPGVLSRAA